VRRSRPLGVLEALPRRVGTKLCEPVDVDDGALRAGCCDDEVPVPPFELLQRGEQLVPLGAALRAADALLGLPACQLEHRDRAHGAVLRLEPALADPGEERLRGVSCIERGIEVDRARHLEQRGAAPGGGRVEQAPCAVEPSGGDARDGRHLLLGELGRSASHLVPDRPLREPAERHELAARADRLG
jgi:hypothetical protein